MRFRGVAILLITVIGIISCQREVDDIFLPAPLPSNDSIYLKQYVEIDTTAARGVDTINKYDFSYDNANRISGYLLTEYIYSPVLKIYSNVKYYYNGNSTLPYKTTMHIQEGNLIYLDTTFYTYSNGNVLRDSIIFYRQNNQELLYTSTTSYTPAGVNVYLRSRNVSYFRGAPTILVDSGLVNITMAGNNISVQTSPPGLLFGAYSKFTYDNNVNPFYRVDIHYPLLEDLRFIFYRNKQ